MKFIYLILIVTVFITSCSPTSKETEQKSRFETEKTEAPQEEKIDVFELKEYGLKSRLENWWTQVSNENPNYNIFHCKKHEKYDSFKTKILNHPNFNQLMLYTSKHIPVAIIEKSYPDFLQHTRTLNKQEIETSLADSKLTSFYGKSGYSLSKFIIQSEERKENALQQTKANEYLSPLIQHESYAYHKYGPIAIFLEGKRKQEDIGNAAIFVMGNNYSILTHTLIAFMIDESESINFD